MSLGVTVATSASHYDHVRDEGNELGISKTKRYRDGSRCDNSTICRL